MMCEGSKLRQGSGFHPKEQRDLEVSNRFILAPSPSVLRIEPSIMWGSSRCLPQSYNLVLLFIYGEGLTKYPRSALNI